MATLWTLLIVFTGAREYYAATVQNFPSQQACQQAATLALDLSRWRGRTSCFEVANPHYRPN